LSATKNNQSVRLAVKVTPNAGRNEITGFKDEVLQVRIAAPPDKGKANKELIDFLAAKLNISKSSLSLLRGAASRHKLLAVTGLTREELLKRLSA
jgi:uncharacterized protein